MQLSLPCHSRIAGRLIGRELRRHGVILQAAALQTEEHLRVLTARQRAMVFDALDDQLEHELDVETRNRKPMRPNPLAPWELRMLS